MPALTMFRGDTAHFDITVTDPANGNAAVNLTGKELRFTAKNAITDIDAAAVISKISTSGGGGGIAITNAAVGQATITLNPSDTDDLVSATQLIWDLQVKVSSTEIYTISNGTLTINPDVTRTI